MSYSSVSIPSEAAESKCHCQHYKRWCSLQCPECNYFFPCHHCHNDKSNHQLDRSLVKRLKCLLCHAEQGVSKQCGNCKAAFGKYCCLKCCMFDDCDKKQFHCNDCGICRTGGQENYFHCKNCCMCYTKEEKDLHSCTILICTVCLENLHCSVQNTKSSLCRHLVHNDCHKAMKKQYGDYSCPTCEKEKGNMASVWEQLDREIESNPMSDEYEETHVWVSCKNCRGLSEAKFHFLGIKCKKCNSYNTRRTTASSVD